MADATAAVRTYAAVCIPKSAKLPLKHAACANSRLEQPLETVPAGLATPNRRQTHSPWTNTPVLERRVGGKGRGRKKTHEGNGQEYGEMRLHGFPLVSVIQQKRPNPLMGHDAAEPANPAHACSPAVSQTSFRAAR